MDAARPLNGFPQQLKKMFTSTTSSDNKAHSCHTTSTLGDRGLAAAGPGLWNSLPSYLKEADLSYNRFWWSLDISVWSHSAM